jgi:Na+/H+ antiporter NhaA
MSLVLCIAPVIALFITIIGEDQVGNPTVREALILGIGWGLAFGFPLGIFSFGLGYAGRKISRSGISM